MLSWWKPRCRKLAKKYTIYSGRNVVYTTIYCMPMKSRFRGQIIGGESNDLYSTDGCMY